MTPTPVTDWENASLSLYKRLFGHRCTICLQPVEDDGTLFEYVYDDHRDFMLAHLGCSKGNTSL